ncbi:MAG TPA: terminase small subunit [Stellaceae bacterium]|nr:terminase small subunit [Stellaceae bacterium]
MRGRRRSADKAPAPVTPEDPTQQFEEIAARAARLGITPERVLEEYARIAFADLSHIVNWGADRVVIKALEEISEGDRAAICEIVAPAAGRGNYRVKLYDKKAALDAIVRHLDLFQATRRHDEQGEPDAEEDPREVLKRSLARIAARRAAGPADRRPDAATGGKTDD